MKYAFYRNIIFVQFDYDNEDFKLDVEAIPQIEYTACG